MLSNDKTFESNIQMCCESVDTAESLGLRRDQGENGATFPMRQ
jgi:hypothetical protein